MRWILALPLALLLASCHFDSGQESYIPPTPQPTGYSPYAAPSNGYIYVADSAQNALLVYANVGHDAPPVTTVPLEASPRGVATDPQGNVYVTLADSKVVIYSSGGAQQAGSISSGVANPSGIATDASGNVWVANQADSDQTQAFVREFSVTTHAQVNTVMLPSGVSAYGVAVGSDGSLWVDVTGGGLGSCVLGYPSGGLKIHDAQPWQWRLPTTAGGGVAFDAQGNLEVGSAQNVLTFGPPSWQRIGLKYFGEGVMATLLNAGQDGTMYYSFAGDGAPSFVMVEPSQNVAAPYKITKGITTPSGVASGE